MNSHEVIMRFTSIIVAVLGLALMVPALAQTAPNGPARIASLRCVQFAMVRDHHHNPNGWPTDCGAELSSQSRKG
jgi:hypothetical protein